MGKRVLVVDVGGTHIKVYAPGSAEPVKLPSGPRLTPRGMLAKVRRAIARQRWRFDAVSIGIPAPVAHGTVLREPANLGRGWTRFDFSAALDAPVAIVNDAAMQALGSYEGGAMLFLGLGTGLGSALVVDGKLVPLELARLPWRDGELEDYVGLRGLRKYGKRRWRKLVAEVVAALRRSLVVDDVVLGGGNAKKLKELPEESRLGSNALASEGGARLWSKESGAASARAKDGARSAAGDDTGEEHVTAP